LAQACQHLWLACGNDVSQEFTCVHHTAHPAPSPPDAGRDTVPSRFGCQSGDCGYRVRGHWTARYLAAVPRRILLMEQQVWSLQRARRSTLRPRVAVLSPHSAFQEHAAHISKWFSMLSSKGSWGTCIPHGIAAFLHCTFTAHHECVERQRRYHANAPSNRSWRRLLYRVLCCSNYPQASGTRPAIEGHHLLV
jgi:hypothetical protein